MGGVSKWELAGVPAVLLFKAAYSLGLFTSIGITEAQLPDVMLLSYAGAVAVRMFFQRRAGKTPQK